MAKRTEHITTTDYTGQKTEWEGDFKRIYSPQDQKESRYTPKLAKWYWYYANVGECNAIVRTLERWIFGKGCNGKDAEKLRKLKGNGKENGLEVVRGIWKVSKICGVGMGEIIKKNGRILNLKAINPESMTIIYSKGGIIKRFEELNTGKKFKPEEIFYIQNDKVGNSMEGASIFESIENLIENRSEVIADLKTLFHRFVVPIRLWIAKTDDEAELNRIEAKINFSYKNHENIVAPEDTLELKSSEIVSTQTGGLSPLEYYRDLIRVFITSCGIPEVIMGWGKDTTEASAKILYLGWEQTVEDEQKKVEDAIERQLGWEINLLFPATIEKSLEKDEKKDGKMEAKL